MEKTTLALLLAFAPAFVSACDGKWDSADELPPPQPINVVCWQDGKEFYSTQAKEASFDGRGRLRVVSPRGPDGAFVEGLQIEFAPGGAACAIVTTSKPIPPASKPAPARPVPQSDAGPAQSDAGPPVQRPR